jgi:hypothetical protein
MRVCFMGGFWGTNFRFDIRLLLAGRYYNSLPRLRIAFDTLATSSIIHDTYVTIGPSPCFVAMLTM